MEDKETTKNLRFNPDFCDVTPKVVPPPCSRLPDLVREFTGQGRSPPDMLMLKNNSPDMLMLKNNPPDMLMLKNNSDLLGLKNNPDIPGVK